MQIEIVILGAGGASTRSLQLPAAATVAEALRIAGVSTSAPVGIWGKTVSRERPLCDGDRVEVYGAGAVDARTARRTRSRPR